MENEKFKTEIEEIQNNVNENLRTDIQNGINDGGKMDGNNNGGDNSRSEEKKSIENNQTGETSEATQIKKGRGRPKGSVKKNANAEDGSKGQPNIKDAKNSLNDDLNEYKRVTSPVSNTNGNPTPNGNPPEGQIDVSKFVSGALLLIAIDAIFPTAIILIMRQFDPKYKYVNKKKLKLTSEEKEELEPLANEVVKLIFGYMPPLQAFLFCMSIVYAGKIMLLSDEDFLIPKPKTIPQNNNSNNNFKNQKENAKKNNSINQRK